MNNFSCPAVQKLAETKNKQDQDSLMLDGKGNNYFLSKNEDPHIQCIFIWSSLKLIEFISFFLIDIKRYLSIFGQKISPYKMN